MIKTQKKWIALLVICSFIWLIQVSTMPVSAAGAAENATLAGVAGPDHYEAVAHKAAPAKKKSILPWILIGAGVVAVAAVVLFLVVLKKGSDIRGTWKFEYLETDGTVWSTLTATFAGTKENGTANSSTGSVSTYTVVDKTVTILKAGGWALHTATFTDDDTINGNWEWISSNKGNFRGTRLSDAAAIRQPAQQGDSMPPHHE